MCTDVRPSMSARSDLRKAAAGSRDPTLMPDRPLSPDELAQADRPRARDAERRPSATMRSRSIALILQRAPPQGGANPRMVVDDFDYRLSADCGDPASGTMAC